jgi:serine/threonine protein kinase
VGCLDENAVVEFLEGRLPAEQRGPLESHLDTCDDCRALVAMLAPAAPQDTVRESPRALDSVGMATTVRFANANDARTEEPERQLLEPGERVEHYEVVKSLGRGGMGEVFLARDTKLGRKVAIKVIERSFLGDADAIARFAQEARAMARVTHPNIVTIHTVGEHAGMPYVAMEYVEGVTLDEYALGRPSMVDIVEIVTAIAEALASAHRRGVVHRDLKPANVIISNEGRARVLDFGLAQMGDVENADTFAPTFVQADDPFTIETSHGGTPRYMAPEQWSKERSTPGTDVWALGVMLYELATGKYPFEARDMVELARAVCFGDPNLDRDDDSVPPGVVELARQCMQKDAESRPSVDELIKALAALPAPSAREDAADPPPTDHPPSASPAVATPDPSWPSPGLAPSPPAPSRWLRNGLALGAATVLGASIAVAFVIPWKGDADTASATVATVVERAAPKPEAAAETPDGETVADETVHDETLSEEDGGPAVAATAVSATPQVPVRRPRPSTEAIPDFGY